MTMQNDVCNRDHCGRCCSACSGGCAIFSLSLDEQRILSLFAQYPFLLVAADAKGQPVCEEPNISVSANDSDALIGLAEKGLISIDYDIPLSGFDYVSYAEYSPYGSMALTALGQGYLDHAAEDR